MTIGPGRYDDQATMVQKATNASGVIVIVIGGDKGEGFACQTTLPVLLNLPAMLRSIADQIEADIPGTPQQ
jgi:hypothetical protein